MDNATWVDTAQWQRLVLGCAGRKPGREPLGERVPRPLLGPLVQPSSACCCSWGLPAEGPGLAGGPEKKHWAQRACGDLNRPGGSTNHG